MYALDFLLFVFDGLAETGSVLVLRVLELGGGDEGAEVGGELGERVDVREVGVVAGNAVGAEHVGGRAEGVGAEESQRQEVRVAHLVFDCEEINHLLLLY